VLCAQLLGVWPGHAHGSKAAGIAIEPSPGARSASRLLAVLIVLWRDGARLIVR
jgi:hypothetical protein